MRRLVWSLGALALIGAAAALAAHFLGDATGELGSDPDAAPRRGDLSALASNDGGDESRAAHDAKDDGSDATPTRVVETVDLFAPPDLATMRALQASGRALFFGLVLDPHGEPCPDAQLYHLGEPVARSDAAGRYRIEVPRNTAFPNSDWPGQVILVAAKPGVGVAIEAPSTLARRLDLYLARGAAFGGRVLERVTRRPVAKARIELRPFFESRQVSTAALFRVTLESDARGAFEYVGLPKCSLEVNCSSAGFHSEGWVGYDMSGGADKLDVDLTVEATIRVRGRFDPWPPPGCESSARALRVAAPPRPWRENEPAEDEPTSSIAEDGSFALDVARTFELNLLLEDGRGALWREQRSIDPDAPEIDLGRIELSRSAAVVGRLDLPSECLELGFHCDVIAPLSGTSRTYRFPIGRDGRFDARPLPAGAVQLQFGLGEFKVGSLTSSVGREWNFFEVLSGEQLDLGTLAPVYTLLCGRVSNARGELVARAPVSAWFPRPGRKESTALDEYTNATGLFLLESWEGAFPPDGSEDRRLPGHIRAESFAGSSPIDVLEPPPARVHALRHDLVVATGVALTGKLLDADGAPLAGWNVGCSAQFPNGFDASLQYVGRSTTTLADGSFAIDGMREGDFHVAATSPEWHSVQLGVVHASSKPVELRLPKQ